MLEAAPASEPVKGQSESEATRDERLAFERLLFEQSSQFANLAGDHFESVTQTALSEIREFLGFDRSSFAQFLDDGSINVLVTTAAEGVSSAGLGKLPLQFEWRHGKMCAGEAIIVRSGPDDLPSEAAAVVEYMQNVGLRSHATIPIRINGSLFGMLAFTAFRETRRWPDCLLGRVRLIGEIIAHAYERIREQEKLATALAEVRSLKDRLENENAYLRNVVQEKLPHGVITRSPCFQVILEEIRQVATTDATVLLLGETGSGKEVLAQAIHDASLRKDRPMVKINCAALPASLIESELFGREKGAFTGANARQMGRFEIANGSTIFLDEIGDLSLELQPKLLRVLQEGEFERLGGGRTIKVNVRVIAATNRNLAQAVSEGKFREDLFYRLNVFPILLPSLRERPEDIPLLSWAFVNEFSISMGKPIEKIADESMSALNAYSWPGNIRELRNVIERAMILEQGSVLNIKIGQRPSQLHVGKPVHITLDQAERAHIILTMQKCGWRIRGVNGAAERLGIKPTTLEVSHEKARRRTGILTLISRTSPSTKHRTQPTAGLRGVHQAVPSQGRAFVRAK